MRILGIDPGIALMGWAVLDKENEIELKDYGCIETSKLKSNQQRILILFENLNKIIAKYKPQIVVLEKLFFNTNAKTALSIGEARGIVKVSSAINKLPLHEFTPLQIKNTITGYGRATKKQVQEMIKVTLKLKEIPKPDDSADAIAIAYTYCCYNRKLEK